MQDNNINPDAMGKQPLEGEPDRDRSNKNKPGDEIQPGSFYEKESENKSELPLTPAEEEKTIRDLHEQKAQDTLQIPPAKPKPKPSNSNYQISLLNENLLKVIVLTSRGVNINSSVKEKKTSTEIQSNEIYLNPKLDSGLQETEILISIEESSDEKQKTDDYVNARLPEREDTVTSKSNYQINLINENLLKIKIETDRGIEIDSVVKDKRTLIQTQSNRIYLQPKSRGEIQEVEIRIFIDSEKKDYKEETLEKASDGQIKFIPNPEVVDLIQPPDYSNLYTAETGDYLQESPGFKNPFDAFRKSIRKNLIIGIIAALALHAIAAGVFVYSVGKKVKEPGHEEHSRLIIIQDLPDPKINLENVEDPNKPKIQEIVPPIEDPDKEEERKREIPPRKIVRPPEVIRPEKETEEDKIDSLIESALTRELDSLRRLLAENKSPDSAATDTDTSAATSYEIPDSLRNTFNENDIGLAMYFPKNWKAIDQREINPKEKNFEGVLLTDTTAEKGTLSFFIFLDPEGKDFKPEEFKTEFKMADSTLIAFSKEPSTQGASTEYRFYIINQLGTEKLKLNASVRKQFFDNYKNEIEAVVRSIKIKKKEDL